MIDKSLFHNSPKFSIIAEFTRISWSAPFEKYTNKTLPTIEGNPSQIRQLFQSFLSNAIKFHEVGKPPKIEIKSRLNKQSGWVISNKDQGIGVNEKYKDRIFRPFERLHGRNEYEGTGMGLAICQKIAENHGGTIFVESQPGQGTCFSVVFPQNGSPLKL